MTLRWRLASLNQFRLISFGDFAFIFAAKQTATVKGAGNKDGLEEETNEAFGVCVQSEGVDVFHILVDVAWEDCNVKTGEGEADEFAMFGEGSEGKPQSDFNNTGGKDDEVLIKRHPCRNLGRKLFASES